MPFEQEKDPMVKRETLELVRAYYKIRESRVRKRVFAAPDAPCCRGGLQMIGSSCANSAHAS